jgi:ribonuclease HII
MSEKLQFIKHLCGIDEAGRGPFAGPMVVAGCELLENIDELNDSKKLSEKKRELLFEEIIKKSKYHIVFSSARQIDELGISACLKNSIQEIIQNIKSDEYLMDGNTSFGFDIKHLIKADAKITNVSAASILAKVSRDRYMINLNEKYPQYQFDKHKGYGTKLHTQILKDFGLSDEHRKSFRIKALES